MEKWKRLLREENILVGMQASRNFDAIRELAGLLADDDDEILDPKRFLADLIRREKQSSTGIGKGVAVPHAHEDSIQHQLLAIGISREGIEFNAIDGEPVHIVALLATPRKHQKQHMELLAALSRLLQQEQVRQNLIAAENAAEVIDIFLGKKNPA
ncbi:MAG: PTS sugar transporter subunit IIA [Gemmatimonadetes bacterium]|nr:PTS sugar transporter subunit IIA [Gemmatimonadota bacterium]